MSSSGPGDDPEAEGGRTPPGPRTLPFVGPTLSFLRDPFRFREACVEQYGDVVDISALGHPTYLVSHPDLVEEVLVRDSGRYRKPRFEMRFVTDVFGRGVSFLDGEAWRDRRQLLQPAFHGDRLGRYAETMVDGTESLTSQWTDGETIRLDECMQSLTFRVLSRTLFGTETRFDPSNLRVAFRAVNDKHRLPEALVPDWIPTRTNRRYKSGLAALETAVDDLIMQRRTADASAGADHAVHGRGSAGTVGGVDSSDDLLGRLLHATDAGDQLDDKALRDEMLGFFFAGHETTAMGLTAVWLLLTEHPAVRADLREKLAAAVDGDRPTVTELTDVPMLDRVISEALRLYPPSHSVARETAEDVVLDGYRIPAGSSLHLPQWVIHRDDRWYDDPDTFDPDRWREHRAADRPGYAYFPFGGGPRRCIGMQFARLELRMALATMLLRCTLDVSDTDPDLEAGLTLRPATAVEATVRMDDGEHRGE